jgi:hypothetical protein
MNVPLIELQDESIAYLEKIGEEAGHQFEITKKDAAGTTIYDKTHFNWAGSYVFGRMVAVDLGKAAPELKRYVRLDTTKLPPEGEKAMHIMLGGPAKIVLVGDSTVATGGGWGPGFCADSQGTSTFFCRNDSESEVSGLPAEPHLGTLQRLLFALVEHRFVICLSCAEQVVDDSGKLVSRSGNSLRLAELATDPAEELSHVVLGVV